MIYTADLIGKSYWMVRRWPKAEKLDRPNGLIDDGSGFRKITNADYDEASISGPANEEQAIEQAKIRNSWA